MEAEHEDAFEDNGRFRPKGHAATNFSWLPTLDFRDMRTRSSGLGPIPLSR